MKPLLFSTSAEATRRLFCRPAAFKSSGCFTLLLLLLLPLIVPAATLHPSDVDIGEVRAGDNPLVTEILLSNTGENPVIIHSVETSCGCTVVDFEKKRIEAGEETRLTLSIDLTGKRGEIEKRITVKTDSGTHAIKVHALVVKGTGGHDKGEGTLQMKIFNEPCAACHSTDEGKEGEALFAAVCEYCHGPNGSGGTAMGLNHLNYLRNISDDELYSAIAAGNEETGMPGFDEAAGGPLTPSQIQSLIPYLRRYQHLFDKKTE